MLVDANLPRCWNCYFVTVTLDLVVLSGIAILLELQSEQRKSSNMTSVLLSMARVGANLSRLRFAAMGMNLMVSRLCTEPQSCRPALTLN